MANNNNIWRFAAVILMLLMLFALGCPTSSSSESDEYYINNIMYKTEQAFNNHDIDALMLNFHPDYLHNGLTLWQIRELWLSRMAEYLLIDFQNVHIETDHDKATVYFSMKLQRENETVYSEEPSAHGDLSYFEYDEGHWWVFGNQHYYKSPLPH